MGLLNGLIIILAVKIFLKIDVWHVNAIPFADISLWDQPKNELQTNLMKTFNHSKYNEMIFVRRKVHFSKRSLGLMSEKARDNAKLKYRTEYEWTCARKGYVKSATGQCVPFCPQSCENGFCKEPSFCDCNKGYRISSDGKCIPECTKGCYNATCVGPEICKCNEGWTMQSDGITCRPVCSMECDRNQGYCSEPNVCSCNAGYRVSSDDKRLCVPECTKGCINGTCIAPEVCKCNEGYQLKSDGFTCSPVCNMECEQDQAYCSEPNVCTCLPGYEPLGFYESQPLCKPKCDPSCILFGNCVAPGRCICDYGYRAVNASGCEPICNKLCRKHSWSDKCVGPKSCRCEDYEFRRSSQYMYYTITDLSCEPICKINCGNGTCTAGSCTCDEGFVFDETNRMCKPHCEISCGANEECTAPNTCTCSEKYRRGYKSFLNGIKFSSFHHKYYTCQPICDFKCINGECTAPNVCTCDLNYYPRWIESHHRLNNNTPRICDPLPGPPCNKFSCGDKGTCHESGICICNDGYAKDTNGDCVPFCIQACGNGTCTAPNHCECHDGFASRNASFCQPICKNGCKNGDCIGPNQCVCYDDFVPNINHLGPECIPQCTRNCSEHSNCIIDRIDDINITYKCECHYGWTGQDCDQSTMCIMEIPYDHEGVNRIRIQNGSTIMQLFEGIPYCECDKSLDNETLCLAQSDTENNTTFISCLFSKDLPCYTTSRYNASINVTKIVWPFVTIAILATTSLIAAAYFVYHKRQQEKLVPSVQIFMRESLGTEILLQ